MDTKKETFKRRGFDLLALGEILLRLSPPVNERLTRGGCVPETGRRRGTQRCIRHIASGSAHGHHIKGSGK